MTEARTAQRGGFMMASIRLRKGEMDGATGFEGASAEFTLRAGNDVRDSRDVEREEVGLGRGRSTLELTDRLVEK